MTVSDAIERLLARIKAKPNTYSSFRHALEPFKASFGERECSDVTSDDIKGYLADLPVSAATKKLRFGQLSQLFNEVQQFLTECDQPIKWVNPCLFLKKEFKTQKKKKPRMSDTIHEDMREIKKTLEPKYLLIYELGTQTGLRISEILSITPSNLMKSGDQCVIAFPELHSKGAQDIRRIPPDLYQKLIEHIDFDDIGVNDQIFPMSRYSVYDYFKRRGITPNDLRLYHLETQLLWMSFYVDQICDFIEHTTVGTTARYMRTP